MALRDLAKALAMLTILFDRSVVQHQWIAADMAAFEPGASHAGAHLFDDQAALQTWRLQSECAVNERIGDNALIDSRRRS